MNKKDTKLGIRDEVIINKILMVRGKKVMIDADLAELYGVTTKRLNEQVRRNIKRFPDDFMFQLDHEEKQRLVEKYAHLNKLKYSSTVPFAFTEHGAVMLASVLNSERAIEVNVQIVRIFVQMRDMLAAHKDILHNLEKMESKVLRHDGDIKSIFKCLRELLNPNKEPLRKIGFKRSDEA